MNTASSNNFQINITKNNNIATLHLSAWFGFHAHKQFKEAYTRLLNETILKSIAVDMSKIEHLDSSALGMLLLLRERTIAAGKSLQLVGPSEYTDKVFQLTNFESLFEIQTLQ
jgi:anti-anti-sigma factor